MNCDVLLPGEDDLDSLPVHETYCGPQRDFAKDAGAIISWYSEFQRVGIRTIRFVLSLYLSICVSLSLHKMTGIRPMSD